MAKDTYIPRHELVDIHREFNKVRQKAEAELMQLPGVLAVGVGLKQVKGEMQRELCFKVTVANKKAMSALKVKDRIPADIYGFKTDVNELAGLALPGSPDTAKYRPLIGGCQIESNNVSDKGTLGCLARRNSDNKVVLLTNWHVVMDNPDSFDGTRVGQPSHNGCCTCCATGEIGKVVDGRFKTGNLDAAIALLHGQESDTNPDQHFLNEILGIGIIAGSAAPLSGETVRKYGRTTRLTIGQISNDNIPLTLPYSFYNNLSVSRTGQIEITPVSDPDYFLLGDSGSVSLNEHHQAVALNYCFIPNTHLTYANKIIDVETALGISIIDSTFDPNPHPSTPHSEKAGVPLGSIAVAPLQVNLADALDELEAELGQFREGKRLLELFKVHRAEMLDLVRHHREVMVAWQRYQGPAFLAHIARSVRRDNKPIPEQIQGISLQNLVLKMTAVLQRNGSPGLVRAVSENYLQIMNILSSGRSPEDWKAYLVQMENLAHT